METSRLVSKGRDQTDKRSSLPTKNAARASRQTRGIFASFPKPTVSSNSFGMTLKSGMIRYDSSDHLCRTRSNFFLCCGRVLASFVFRVTTNNDSSPRVAHPKNFPPPYLPPLAASRSPFCRRYCCGVHEFCPGPPVPHRHETDQHNIFSVSAGGDVREFHRRLH